MKNKGFIEIGEALFLILLFIGICFGLYLLDKKEAEKIGCKDITLDECKCIQVGGIYIGANCVFPPQKIYDTK